MSTLNANVELDGATLRQLRQLAGYNLVDFASVVNCSFQYLSQLERNPDRACSPALYGRICDALELTDRRALLRRAPVAVGGVAA